MAVTKLKNEITSCVAAVVCRDRRSWHFPSTNAYRPSNRLNSANKSCFTGSERLSPRATLLTKLRCTPSRRATRVYIPHTEFDQCIKFFQLRRWRLFFCRRLLLAHMSFTHFYLDAFGRFARRVHAQQLSILARLVPTLLLAEDSHLVKSFSSMRGGPPMHELRKPGILCIDDTASEVEMRLRKSVLEIAGYGVWATGNPWEAVRILRNNDVELVLTEHIVPVNGGPPLTQVLKRLKPYVPVIIYAAWEVPPESIGMADRFIPKLVSTDELLCTIEELLAKAQLRAVA